MQFIQHYSPATLTLMAHDLTKVRYHTRDDACAALAVCEQCAVYGGEVPTLIVLPNEGPKSGFILHEVEQPVPPCDDGEDTSTGHTAAADLGNADQIEEE